MKIAVSSYSFRQAIEKGMMTLKDVIPKAKEMGFAGIEIVPIEESAGDMQQLAPFLVKQAEECGISLVAYLVTNDFVLDGVQASMDRLKAHIDAAAMMGIPLFRNDATAGKDKKGNELPWEESLPILVEGYGQTAEYAKGAGMLSTIENHGFYAQRSTRVKQLIDQVNHDHFGWLCDIGNFICADEDPAEAVKRAAPYAFHAHAKDFFLKPKGSFLPHSGWKVTPGGMLRRGTVIGHGDIPIRECLGHLHEAGYDKWISIEFEGIEDCIYAIQEGAANLGTLLETAGYTVE